MLTNTAQLGRGAIVKPGQDVPAWLDGAPRHRLDAKGLADPEPLITTLHLSWVRREPVVVELAVAPSELTAQERYDDQVWSASPTLLFPRERLCHLVWANNLDLRSGEPRWWHAVKAVRANPNLHLREGAGGPDAVLADGTRVVIDGGPRQPLCDLTGDLGDSASDAAAGAAHEACRCAQVEVVLLHRDDTEHGTFAPLTCARGAQTQHLAQLAPDQKAAVTASLGAVRVAAPAGSGKTRVLTARLAESAARGTPPDSVLALAYNTKAAAELRARTAGGSSRGGAMKTATVHSYALEILRRYAGRPPVVLDERERRGILSRFVDLPRRANSDPLQPYLDAIDEVRVALRDPEKVQADNDDIDDLARIFTGFRAELDRRGAVDFPDMVYAAIELLLRDPAVRAAEQRRVTEILVDEFQDLTPAYLLLIRLLASPQLQCFGVGDDDQVIYGHSGASPRFLLDFPKLFPGAEDHPLEINYRCPAPVVVAADTLLRNNTVRLTKTIRAREDAPATDIVVKLVTDAEQANAVGALIDGMLAEGRGADDIAVLARVRVSLLGTQAELATRGISCTSPIGDWLLQRTGVRAALAYLRLGTAEEMAGEDLAQVLHRPLRGVPGSFRDHLRTQATWRPEQLTSLADRVLRGRQRSAWQRLSEDLGLLRHRLQRQPTAEALGFISEVIGLGDAMRSLDASAGGDAGSSHIDDLSALVQVADHCKVPAEFEGFLTKVVRQPAPDGAAVTLSTVHSVKGLEWPEVVIVDAAEGITPHRLAAGAAALEEERRVFHVALTRASSRLSIVGPKTGTSRFVAEMRGGPTPLGRHDAPRRSVGTRTSGSSSGPRRRVGKGKRATSSRAVSNRTVSNRTGKTAGHRAGVGVQLRAAGGLEGAVETVNDDGALVRTARGSLLLVRYGEEVRVEGRLAPLRRP